MLHGWGDPFSCVPFKRRSQSRHALRMHFQPPICQVQSSWGWERHLDVNREYLCFCFSNLIYLLFECWVGVFLCTGVQLFWAVFLSPLWGVPAEHGACVHGVPSVHGWWEWCQELSLQFGGGREWAEAHMGGHPSQHKRWSQKGQGQSWRPHHTEEYGALLLWWRSTGTQVEGHWSDMERTSSPSSS